MSKKSPIPPGAYVGVNVNNIDEGKLKKRLDRQLTRAMKELKDYEEQSGDRSGKAVITATIALARSKDSKEFWAITYGVKIATPMPKNLSLVKERNGHLLCQPTGASEFDPDQMVIFDDKGRPIGGTDPETGEVYDGADKPTVAGSIGQVAAQA